MKSGGPKIFILTIVADWSDGGIGLDNFQSNSGADRLE